MSLPDVPAAKPQARWVTGLPMAALLVYWPLLFVSTHVPIDPDVTLPGNDKSLHFVGYGILALLMGAVLITQKRTFERRRFPFAGAFFLLSLYAAFDELTQRLVGRHCDLQDWLADVAGIAIGLFVAACISQLLKARL
jgi:VanZ family protein